VGEERQNGWRYKPPPILLLVPDSYAAFAGRFRMGLPSAFLALIFTPCHNWLSQGEDIDLLKHWKDDGGTSDIPVAFVKNSDKRLSV
jgi:hypothetical protein